MGKLLLVKRTEWLRLGYFFLLFFVISAGLAIGRGTADALFLKRFGIQYLPAMYLALGVLMMVISTVYAAYADRIAPERAFYALLGGLAVLLVGNWYLMTLPTDSAAYPIYFLVFEVSSEVLVMHASLYFSANFDAEQSKRLLPMTFAGLQLGEIAGGLTLTATSLIGVQGLVLVWSGLSAIAVVIVALRHRSVGVSPFFTPGRRGGGLQHTLEQVTQGLKFTRRSPLLLYSSVAVFFMVVALYSLGYAAYAVYNESFSTAAELSALFGVLTIVSSSITMVVQILFTSKLINRFGVRTINLVFPVTTLFCFLALMISFMLPSAIISTLNRRILLPAIRNPSRILLFDALPDYMQGRARALSLALVLPAAYVFVGFALQALKEFHAPVSYLVAGTVAGALYLVFSFKTNRAYVEALVATLKERLFLPSEGLSTTADPELFERLVDGVRHRDEQICLTYARMLASAFPEKAPEIIFERMQRASSPVFDQLIRLIGPYLPESLLQQLVSEREEGDAHERATVLETRFEAKDSRAQALVEGCLASDNPRLIACGIWGVFKYDLAARREFALTRWREMLADPRKACIFAALTLGRKLAMPEAFLPQLCSLLDHPDDNVKKAVLRALRGSALPADARLLAMLATIMQSRDQLMRMACVECYRLLPGPDRERLCLEALADRHPSVVEVALRVLEEATDDVHARLFAWLNDVCAPPHQQQRVVAYLSRHAVERQPFEDYAARKLQDAAIIAQAMRVLEGDATRSDAAAKLFKIVLAERFGQTLEVALQAMENLSDSYSIRIVSMALKSKDVRQVARAREALANVANSQLGAQLSRLLAGEGEQRAAPDATAGAVRFAGTAEVLAWCEKHADRWLSECARHALAAKPTGP
jgi:hypothetical protein